MPAKAILHFVSLLTLHVEFVMKQTCKSDFSSSAFHFSEIVVYFTHLFDFVCHVDVHAP